MAETSKIQWTEATWNPTTGCTKLSSGCKNCYAERDWPRLAANPSSVYFGRRFIDIETHANRVDMPRHWREPRMIFVDSMSDLFHERVPDTFLREVFATMRETPRHTFQILTKRSGRMMSFALELAESWGEWPAHIWIGVSAEDQLTFDERVPDLLATPARIRFVSAEPLLGMIDARGYTSGWNGWWRARSSEEQRAAHSWPLASLAWVIAGGESGPDARPMHPKWIRWLRDQCELVRVPFFFKQWGEWAPPEEISPLALQRQKGRFTFDTEPRETLYRVGKKLAGNLLEGKQHEAWPAG